MPHPPADPPGSPPPLRRVVDDLDAIVWVYNPAAERYTFVSEGSWRVLGVDPEGWRRADLLARIHPDERARISAAFGRLLADGERFDESFQVETGGGWRRLRELAHRDTVDGVPQIVGITVTSPADESDDRFRSVIEHLPAIVYIEDLPGATQGRLRYVSPQVEALLGFTQEEWLADPLAWARQFHPGDRARMRAIYDRIEASDDPFLAEYRMFARDGSVRWFRDQAVVVRDANGAPSYWQGVMTDVTHEHGPREDEDGSDERYRALLEHIPAIVYREDVRGDDLQVVYISPRVEVLLGIPPVEWIADPGVWLRSIHPDDRPQVEAENRRTELTGEPFLVEYRMLARNGTVVWFRDEAELVRDDQGRPEAWQGVMMDITARKAAEAGLAEADARYRALVEQLPAIAYIDPVDRRGTVYISPQTTTILGYTPEEWYADPDLWRRIVVPEDHERLDAERGSPLPSTYRVRTKDGDEIWVHDQARPVYDDTGALVYWQGLLLDITDQRRTLELERALDLERVEAERLRTEDELKTTLLHAVSHDLRTPLAAILGLAVTLERDDLALSTDESRDLAHRIAQNARRLDRMVADFLDLERLRRGVTDLAFAPVDLGALVREIVADADLVAERRLALDVVPVTIQADAGMLERIIENLLANTVKHTPAESRIWVRVGPADGGAELVVEDDGPGVADEDKARIFEPFRQGAHAATGSGVGLALVARFAELHDGQAWVDDRPGGGASFHVTLAAEPSERRIDLTGLEADQETAAGSGADNQA